jgi:nitrogen fixation/metabolism regulation signal transduction histidine kinase
MNFLLWVYIVPMIICLGFTLVFGILDLREDLRERREGSDYRRLEWGQVIALTIVSIIPLVNLGILILGIADFLKEYMDKPVVPYKKPS